WTDQWAILSHGQNSSCATGTICGNLFSNRKALLSLFNDAGEEIQTMKLTEFSLTLQVPQEVILASDDNINAFSGLPLLAINNDQDDAVNEDGVLDDGACNLFSSRDADCDDREDEDSPEDPVVYWKFSDNLGNSLVPKEGCLGEDNEALLQGGSELCEKAFTRTGDEISVTLGQEAMGITSNNEEKSIAEFLNEIPDGSQLQLELLVVAPLEQTDTDLQKIIPIPELDYSLAYVDENNEVMPDPFFVIQSDGHYLDFQQSITTTITPKTSVPLQDFTIIQQQ
ncbi:MAG: hypothetical protein V1908_04815, partial [Candidatus Peregrinibacteria bacterium]